MWDPWDGLEGKMGHQVQLTDQQTVAACPACFLEDCEELFDFICYIEQQ